jgi:hypothetical protein
MINRVNPNPAARFIVHNRQAENKNRNEGKRNQLGATDKVEISAKARDALKNPPVKQEIVDEQEKAVDDIISEYVDRVTTGRTDDTDDAANMERRKKLAAMKIAMRISNGDNVPMQDHRFLAEYDPKLYKAALKASLVADNDDPKDYDSLVEEMFGEGNVEVSSESEYSEVEADGATAETVDVIVESFDYY